MAIATFLGGLECAVMIVVACIMLMRPLFSRSQARNPPKVRNHEHTLDEVAHLEIGKKKAAAKLPRLLDPPFWFDNEDDVDVQVELRAKKDVQGMDAESSSSSHTSGAPKDTVADGNTWAAPVSWHAYEEGCKPGLHDPSIVHADAL